MDDDAGRNTVLCYMTQRYRELDEQVRTFMPLCGSACPSGCGICCTSEYEPEVTPEEGEYAAKYIIEFRSDLESRFDRINSREYCIFYDEHSPLHCTIYPVRPVICRGFGFCGYTTKSGGFAYRPCRYMEQTAQPVTIADGPVLSHYHFQYACASTTLPISDAIFRAWQKLRYRMAEGEEPDAC